MELKRLDKPKPFVIISHRRSGSTFLAHCINNHPMAFCVFDEPLRLRANYLKACSYDPIKVLDIVFGHTQVLASGGKVLYSHFIEYQPVVTKYLEQYEIKVIHLYRKNYILASLSDVLRTHSRAGYHTLAFFQNPQPEKVSIDPERVIACAWERKKEERKIIPFLKTGKVPVLTLTYEDLVGREGEEVWHIVQPAHDQINKFLDLPDWPLQAPFNRKTVKNPLDQISNWNEIREEVLKSKFAFCVGEIEEVFGGKR